MIKDLFNKSKENYLRLLEAKKKNLNHFDDEIETLGSSSKIIIDGKQYISFTNNDYLGISNHTRVKEACIDAIKKYGNGVCGSRVAGGTSYIHKQLERTIAKFTNEESAVLFNTGYMTNLAIADILTDEDAVICDRLDHASIFDGIRLCKAKLYRFKHNDVQSLEEQLKKSVNYKIKLIFIESVYSMDGDIAPLPEIVYLAEKYGAYLALDEAHSIGTLGKTGRGILEYYNIPNEKIDIRMGTLSKSAGAVGGFVVGDKNSTEIIRYNSRQYIFTASLPFSVVAGANEAFKIITENSKIVQDLQQKYTLFAKRLREYGFNLGKSNSQIIPIIVGDEEKACQIHNLLLSEGFYLTSIVHPVVPLKEARLRIGVTAAHSEDDLDRLYNSLVKINNKFRLINK